MDDEEASRRFGSPLRPLLTYGVPIVGAGVWAFSRFPQQLRWTSDVFARVFGLAAAFYEDFTHVEGYGDALEAAIDALEAEPIRVLDVGCGTGFAGRQIQQAFPDTEVVGVDLAPEMVLIARTEADQDGLDIEFEVGDGADLEFEDEEFDLVVSHNAPPYPDEMMRVLRPTGIALTVWSFGGPWVGLAWPALARQLKRSGALNADGFRAGPGFYGVAEKSGIRRRRPRPERPERPAFSPPPPPPPPAPPAPKAASGARSEGRPKPQSAAARTPARVAKPEVERAPEGSNGAQPAQAPRRRTAAPKAKSSTTPRKAPARRRPAATKAPTTRRPPPDGTGS